ncbi:MAG: hypothetical protein ACRCXM_08945 [Beijerinckiaceae bacterium]
MISAKTNALRFRIWQYAAPREWDVSIAEIAEAISESIYIVRQCIRNNPAWHGRVRWETTGGGGGLGKGSVNYLASHTAKDIVSGRITMDETV